MMRTWFWLLTPALLTGCFDFETQELVLDLRPLTAVASPPEIMVDIRPGEGEEPLFVVVDDPAPSTLSLLIINPQAPDVPLRISGEACLSNERHVCDPEEGPVMALGDFSAPPGVIELPFRPSAQQLNDWLAADPFQGYGGLYIVTIFSVEQAGFPGDRISKLVTYNVPFVPQGEDQDPPPPKVPNRNPHLDGLLVAGALRTEAMGFAVAADERVDLEPVYNEDIAIEDYPVANFPDVETGDVSYSVLTEKLEFQFYSTGGTFTSDKIETRNPLGEIEEVKTTFRAPDPFTEPLTLWVITRDDRGGSSWTTWTVSPLP